MAARGADPGCRARALGVIEDVDRAVRGAAALVPLLRSEGSPTPGGASLCPPPRGFSSSAPSPSAGKERRAAAAGRARIHSRARARVAVEPPRGTSPEVSRRAPAAGPLAPAYRETLTSRRECAGRAARRGARGDQALEIDPPGV